MNPEGARGRPPAPHRRRRRASIEVLVQDARGGAGAVAGLARWLSSVAPARARGTVSLAILSDHRVRTLNRQYLGRDYPTDVLSFPAENSLTRAQRFRRPPRSNTSQVLDEGLGRGTPSFSAAASSASSASSTVFLGDIAIARGVARRQASAAGHSELTELRVLALHGLLHLLGYDHEHDRGEMYRVERRLRRKGGLRESLIERAHTARGGPVEPRATRQ